MAEASACPNCKAPVPRGTSICPQCDFIIDASFLEAPAEKKKPAPRASPPRRAPPPRADTPPEAPLEPPPPPARAAPSAATRGPVPPPIEVGNTLDIPSQFMEDVRAFFVRLSSGDKLAMLGLSLTLIVSAFPWKETAAEGEVLGVMSLGFLSFALDLVALVALVLRARGGFKKSPLALPWGIQLGGIGLSLLWCLIFIRLSWDGRRVPSPVGNFEMWASKPAFGVVLGIVGGLLALGGTLMGLQERAV